MTTEDFREFVKRGEALDSAEIHAFMDRMSDEARRITFELNAAYHTPEEVRSLLSQLFGYEVPSSLRVFPPLYTDYGKNITVGEGVFINACCHFQDHGGVTIGDGCQIGHNVVFATLNHELAPERRKTTRPAPIVFMDRLECDHIAGSRHRRQCRCCCRCCRHERCGVRYHCRRSSGEVYQKHIGSMNAKAIIFTAFFMISNFLASAQDVNCNQNQREAICTKLPMSDDGIIRLSKIEVDPAYLDEYMKFATEVGEISLRTEPGVLTMYALQEKENPCNITILETYASQEAYRKHIASAHFQKYKQGTLHMVKNLQILDHAELNPASRIVNYIE